MKLNYRGLSYEANSQNIEIAQTEINGKFRGLNYHISRPVNSAGSSVGVTLKFRGVSYSKI
ncbi:DUF4278 domain-containing protein [Chlorogloeopsis sp. ULAP02]|uniref:DUF4278 domain-containing protein n=1 Tax=Chlorogloeopsis sp. ULAP02 TaxID=3107926 RepID=UPI003135C00E